MRAIATFEDERSARLFADVLCTREIETEVSKRLDGTYSVWVLEERNVEASRAAWAAFDANPDAPDHLAAAGAVERKNKTAEQADRKSRHEVIDVSQRYRPGPRRPAPATVVLVFISVAATIAIGLLGRVDVREALSIGPMSELTVGGRFSHVEQGQVWRLITPIFLHYSFLHILFNMWWLLDLGSVLEHRIGSIRFLFLVLLSAAVSNAAQYMIIGSPLFGGMSGVLYALFGYVWIRGRFDPTMGFALTRGTVVALLVWLILGFSGAIGPIANYAHLGGLVVGVLLGARAAFSARK